MADVGSNLTPGKPTGVSCLCFDTEEELIWLGNYSGHLTSFVPSQSSYNNLIKYTSFHIDYESDIRYFLSFSTMSLVISYFAVQTQANIYLS